MADNLVIQHTGGGQGTRPQTVDDLGREFIVLGGLAGTHAVLLLYRRDEGRRPFDMAGSPVAQPEDVPAPRFQVELGVKGRHAVDFAQRDPQPVGDELQHLRREIPVERLRPLQHRDQSALLPLVLVKDLIHQRKIGRAAARHASTHLSEENTIATKKEASAQRSIP